MSSFVDRHRSRLMALVSVAGLATMLWLDAADGAVAKGRPVPEMTLRELGGGPVPLSSLRGQPVVLDFWASWCGPCRQSLPHVEALAGRYAGKVRFFAVNAEDEPTVVQERAWQRLGLSLPVLENGAQLSRWMGVNLLPTTVVVGRDGRVAASFSGAVSPSQLAAALEALP